MPNVKTIAPQAAADLVARGAVLVDIREADEHARERIPGARHRPLARLAAESVRQAGDETLIFHCRSGARTLANAAKLSECASGGEVFVLEGGIDAWKRAGLPVALDRAQPIEVQRQVQIAAGGLVLLGVALGAAVAPGFYALAGLIGAGLVFAGATGFCGMARVLGALPWNRRSDAAP